MKKYISLLLIVIISLITVSCGSEGTRTPGNTPQSTGKTVQDVLTEGVEKAENGDSSVPESSSDTSSGGDMASRVVPAWETSYVQEEIPDVLSVTDGVDVDLTYLSDSVGYAMINDMMYHPENYYGKIIKVPGTFDTYRNPDTGKDFYACVFADATACCVQELDFVLADGESGYPTKYDPIVIVGSFCQFQEGDIIYYGLKDCKFVW